MRTSHVLATTLVTQFLCIAASAGTAFSAPQLGPDPKQYQTTVDRAVQYLAERQADDGAIGARIGIGPTAITAMALLRCGHTATDPMVAKSLNLLEEFVQEDGGIHTPGSHIPNYETCIALMCFKEANRDGRYNKTIKDAEAFIRGGQIDETKGKPKSDFSYGGEGYGGRSRPDLSNTAFLLDALKSCGAGADDPAVQKALVFVSRCQNLESDHNTTPFASKVNDGGFYYTCTLGKQEESREAGPQALRSYGSMTYSGLKSMLYAGLSKDDPRVKAALQWISKNYDLENNPGQGDAGLYYYYHTFAKTMDVLGVDRFEDVKGMKHDWRRELTEALAKRQQPNGSWVNKNTKWMEGDPELATPLALLALTYCRPTTDTANVK